MRFILFLFLFSVFSFVLCAQNIKGDISVEGEGVAFANVVIEGLNIGASSDQTGKYILKNVPLGKHNVIVSSVGMKTQKKEIIVVLGINKLNFDLEKTTFNLNQVVVTATKTMKKKIESPVIVNIINSEKMESVQACNLSEALNFQSGLRVETDCQTCNYTQLRMNGLLGGYSQILINGRSIFSPLAGLYAMEQLPVNIIEKIEIIKGGGSSLYGSSAIAGIVNIITRTPVKNASSFSYNFHNINQKASENSFYINMDLLLESKKGVSFFGNIRDREWYDHNGDRFSELPRINDKSFGMNLFFYPFSNHKLQMSIASINEYRYGGQMIDVLPHFAMQSEERNHEILLGNIDYQINFDSKSLLSVYLAAQSTGRDHYTGVRPDVSSEEDTVHLLDPPYGSSLSVTRQAGFQIDHSIDDFFGAHVFSLGGEYMGDDVYDEISSYNYILDQEILNIGWFVQSDWRLNNRFSVLSGSRFDSHSLLENIIISPRLSLLYNYEKRTQFRVSYSSGFRAPQAFDADMHMAFAGGGVSRVVLDENLVEERSKSLSTSINYDNVSEVYFYGFTFEGFYTRLDNVFSLEFLNSDTYGDVFVKKNNTGAVVKGVSFEGRFNYNQKIQLESSFTIQDSEYSSPVVYSNDLLASKDFLKTPNKYGYIIVSYIPNNLFKISANLIHTGSMSVIHFAGSPEQAQDEYYSTEIFNTIGLKSVYTSGFPKLGFNVEWSVGVKNLTNSYQEFFDTSKLRDSNFIYGPALPRTFYFGVVINL